MTFRDWRQWVGRMEWPLKWFLILIIIRPIIDNFYYLKEISPLLSPLYIVGVATPILALYAIIKIPKPNYSRIDDYFLIFTGLITISCFGLLIGDGFSLDSLDFTLKFLFTPFVYFFCRRLIRSKKDLHGVFQTFIYSSVFIILIFSYELIFNPINIQISRGLERYHGSFADVMSYSIYMTGGLLILAYAYFERNINISTKTRLTLLIFAIGFSILMLFHIHHTASYIVSAAVMLLFVLHNFKANIGLSIVAVMFAAGVIYFTGAGTLSSKFMPLIETDISVYEGERGDEALLHGRVGRWMSFFDHFSSKGMLVQFFGLPLEFGDPFMYIGKGSHNDFVRTTMLTGYTGLIVYLFLLFSIFQRTLKHNMPVHFLGLGMLAIVGLYSLTTTPLLYPILLYIALPFYASLALPKEMLD